MGKNNKITENKARKSVQYTHLWYDVDMHLQYTLLFCNIHFYMIHFQ